MTRFLHTADLHLNALRRNFPHYLLRGEWVLNAITEAADDYDCDCIVVAGDVFDRTDLTIAERQLFSDWLGGLSVPAIITSGNHDTRNDSETGNTCLSYLSSLNLKKHLVHDGDPRILNAFGAWWFLFPHYRCTDFEFHLMVETMLWRVDQMDSSMPVVGVLHDALVGSQADSGYNIEGRLTLNPDWNVAYWALGDIHLSQEMLPNAHYSGSPHQIDFGEDLRKGVLIVDTDKPTEPGFVEFDTPYPLIALDEPPDDWSLFCKYKGVDLPDGTPDHVVWDPPQKEAAAIEYGESRVPLLYGLEQKLMDIDHDDELIDRTIEMAKELVGEIGLEV